MQTVEEKLRILADAVRDDEDILVCTHMFEGNAKELVCTRMTNPEFSGIFRDSKTWVERCRPNDEEYQKYSLSRIERDAVLAGLRMLQKHMGPNLDSEIVDILCDSSRGLGHVEIDQLCNKLNQW